MPYSNRKYLKKEYQHLVMAHYAEDGRFGPSTPPLLHVPAVAIDLFAAACICVMGWFFFSTAFGVAKMVVDLCGPPSSVATPILLLS